MPAHVILKRKRHGNKLQVKKNRRLEVQEKIEENKKSDPSSYGDGIHEAINDIVKTMKTLTRYLT